MARLQKIILIHSAASPKPAVGVPCNGCGVCCLYEPCPLGVVLSRRRQGSCVAVRWSEDSAQYRCGALCESEAVLRSLFPARMGSVVPWLAPVLMKLAQRWIGLGIGCDSTLESVKPKGGPLT